MNDTRYLLVLTALFLCIWGVLSKEKLNLPPPDGSFKILMLLPFASQSHRNCFLPLAEGLADRGHQVVILSPLPPRSKHPNVKEINHGLDVADKSIFEIRENDPTGGLTPFKDFLPAFMSQMYNVTTVKDLYNSRHDFDLMIINEMFNEPAYPFLVGKKFIAIGTAGISPFISAVLGNILHPSYTSFLQDYPRPFSLKNRIYSLFWHIYLPLYWRTIEVVPAIQKVADELFPGIPPLLQIEREGLTLVLANDHFSLDAPIPRLPSQVEVGGMHCRPGEKLPQDLQSWIDGAGSTGVIYFSFGSVCLGTTMPIKYKQIMIKAFGKLKQRVIWKFEEDIPDLPTNVIVRKWLPQQDILAHPNVKLFITHGGLLSMQEAVYHATPLLAIPIFWDQPKNAKRIRNKGFGEYLIWEELTVEKVVDFIQEITTNPSYQNTISTASESFRDQPAKPLETAIWWTEYVIRHKGAPQLRSPAQDLSWVEFLMLDVILIFHIIVFVLIWSIRKILAVIYRTLLTGNNGKKLNIKNKLE